MTAAVRTLGPFEVLHALKAGGMGEVLLGRRRGLAGFEQLCAIKTIRPELAEAPLLRAMFLDEARLLARLNHPAIAHILDFGEHDGAVYMAIEYVAGEHFRRFGERRPPAAIVCQAVAAACRGLHAAHELRDLGDGHLLGVVHRDISPDNLMVGFDGRVKVLDFGIALVKGRQAPATEFGTLKGKPPYMSPEQLRNQPLDRRADVFSIAVVLHELLTGRHLFTGDSIYAVVHAVEHQPIVPPSQLAGPLPPELDDVVMAGLERDRDHRLRSAAAMAEVLERIAAAHGGESLESWAERTLSADRDEHRRWMATVLGGSAVMTAGRPTGVVTAVADAPPTDVDPRPPSHHPDAVRATLLAEASSPGASTAAPAAAPVSPRLEVRGPTALEATVTDGAVAPRRRRRTAWAAGLVLVVGAGLALVLVLGSGAGRQASVPADAAVDAPVALPVALDAAPPTIDAAVIVDVPVDAAVVVLDPPVDAGRRRDAGEPRPREPIDAGPRPRDAQPPAVDAAAVEPAAGTGFLSVSAEPDQAVVNVDGQDWGSTPKYRRPLTAGRHEVVFKDLDGGAELYRTTVVIEAGKVRLLTLPRATP